MVRLATIRARLTPPDTRRVKPHEPERAGKSVYDSSEWRALRDAVRRERGQRCEKCGAGGRVWVDHIVEIKDGGAPYDRANLQVLCKSCHERKTAEARRQRNLEARAERPDSVNTSPHPPNLKPSKVPVVVVCGPPASGKSTWVAERAGPDDLVLDLDQIAVRVLEQQVHAWDRSRLPLVLSERNRLLFALAGAPPWPRAWLIVSEPEAKWREWWACRLRPERIIVLEVDDEVCWERIRQDPARRCQIADQSAGVARWWAQYVLRAGDEVIRG